MLSGSFHVYVCGVTTSGAAYCWAATRTAGWATDDEQSRSVPTRSSGLDVPRGEPGSYIRAA